MDLLDRLDEPTLDLETAATEEFERQPAICESSDRDECYVPPQFRNGPHTSHRTDSAHRELLRHPFMMD